VNISKALNVDTKVVISRMDDPIGLTVGNSIEVAEAIDCLRGGGPHDTVELVQTLGSVILLAKGKIPLLFCCLIKQKFSQLMKLLL